MKQTIRDIIGSGRNQSADSRAVALTRLSSCLQETGPIVIWLHGMAGAGKGSLLDAFALNTAGTRVVRIDCRTIEPTSAGLLATLGDFGLQARAVLVFENYEVLKYGASTRTVGSITLENRRMNWKNLRFLAVCTLAIASNMITMSVLAGDEEAVAGPTL